MSLLPCGLSHTRDSPPTVTPAYPLYRERRIPDGHGGLTAEAVLYRI
jgi:hypothetical protein